MCTSGEGNTLHTLADNDEGLENLRASFMDDPKEVGSLLRAITTGRQDIEAPLVTKSINPSSHVCILDIR